MKERTSKRCMGYLFFAILVMMICWESNRSGVALAQSAIPEESIRLRILANSDSPADQRVKREVRDSIVSAMQQWVTGPQTIEQARATVTAHLPELELLTGGILREHGFDYGYHVELGIVPFPTKMYGDEVYPAGNYEALRVTLGQGAGQNWWCVLFPPLCFVDAVTGDAVSVKAPVNAKAASAKTTGKLDPNNSVKNKASSAANDKAAKSSKTSQVSLSSSSVDTQDSQEDARLKPEYRFFLWDMVRSLFA
jgi:stage II sporulation protein R